MLNQYKHPAPRHVIVAAGMLLAMAPNALAQFAMDPATNYAAVTEPGGVAAGDYNGDGHVDLATTAGGPDRIVVLLNDGTGLYTAGPSSAIAASSSPQDLIAADLDGDNDMDLAVAVRDPSGRVLIMLNGGTGTFSMAGMVLVGDRPRGLTAADIDGDNDMDLAVANRDSITASVLVNNGAGGFTEAQVLTIGGEPRRAEYGDLDDDGDADLAVTNSDNRSIELFTNTGGVFSASTILSVGPDVRPDGVDSADLDDDGDTDLAVAVSDQTLNINQVMVFLQTPAGFSGPLGYNTGGTNTSEVVAADLDCDGLMDLAAVSPDSNNLSQLRNLGGGVYGAAQLQTAGTTPGEIAATDLDGDGDPDLVVVNRDSDNVSVIRNQTCEPAAPCPWDTGGDGMVGTTDLLALLAAWGPNPGHPSDFDGNGIVDTVDLLAQLANWGACP